MHPCASLYRVELYINRPREEKEAENGDNPPPSLWQNHELRSNLGDRAAQLSVYDEEQITIHRSPPDALLKQRLLIYAEQTLSRNRKMEHYALDLFALARMAFDPGIPSDIRSKALAICLAHAKNLEKNIGKLASGSGAGDSRLCKRGKRICSTGSWSAYRKQASSGRSRADLYLCSKHRPARSSFYLPGILHGRIGRAAQSQPA